VFADTVAIADMFFLDTLHGWAAGNGAVNYYTVDGGLHWTAVTAPGNSNMSSIFFTDVLNGWSVDLNGQVFHSTNGGQSWTLKATVNGFMAPCVSAVGRMVKPVAADDPALKRVEELDHLQIGAEVVVLDPSLAAVSGMVERVTCGPTMQRIDEGDACDLAIQRDDGPRMAGIGGVGEFADVVEKGPAAATQHSLDESATTPCTLNEVGMGACFVQ
jgi:Photosynthesis system II assembly factor YCF48